MNYKEHRYTFSQQHLRQCQLKQLGILKEIDAICRRHDIKYWLHGGTLLGAMRHGGFIPWDDDIDIAMDYQDMKRFEQIAPQELPEGLFLQSPKTDPSIKEQMVKIRDLNSLYIEKGDNFVDDYVKGIFVDIFPFEAHPDIPKSWIKRLAKGITKSVSILHHPHTYSLRSFAEFFWFGGKLLLFLATWRLLALVTKSSRYANIPTMNGYGITHDRTTVLPLSEVKFEDASFPAPHDPDQYLRNIYGNYMEVPPVEKRHFHSVVIIPELV
jgi:lipopolysaccharide cholinephosphotransferase